MTVLFCDVTGFTTLAEESDPEALRATMDRYFAGARAVIEAHGGTVEKYIGDAVMAVFGLPTVHEDDAVRCLRAAHQLQGSPSASGDPALRLRVGISSGEVIARSAQGGEAFVTGDAVNVAARLEQAADPGEVLVDEATMLLAAASATFEPRGALELKGRRGRAAAFRLVSVRPATAPSIRADQTALIGRAAELAQLASALDRAVNERRPHLFTVLGAPGVGKSRLVAELARSRRTLTGRCLPYGDGITYWPIREIVSGLVRAHDTEADPVLVLAKRLADQRDGGLIASRIGAIAGWTDDAIPPDEAAWAVRRLLETEAKVARGLVVVVDDIQWAEPSLLELLEHVLDWSRDAPMLLLCLARPELLDVRPTWGGGRINATALLLEPLPGDAARAMLDQLGGPVPVEVVDRILALADGVPLFLEQILASISDSGSLPGAAGTGLLELPATIHALLQARVNNVPAAERRLLAAAAVIGEEFDRDALGALCAMPESELDGALLGTMRRQLTRAKPDGESGLYQFRHLLIRDAAYEGVPKRERAALHARLAEWLAVSGVGQAGVEDITAHHLEAAGAYRSEIGLPADAELTAAAVTHLRAAARRAQGHGDWTAAQTFLSRALRLLPGEASGRMQLLADLGQAQHHAGHYTAAVQSLDAAIRLAREARDGAAELHFRALRTGPSRVMDPDAGIAEVRALLRSGRTDLAADEHALVALLEVEADLAEYDGRIGDGIVAVRHALDVARQLGDPAAVERLRDFEIHLALYGATGLDEADALVAARLSDTDHGSLQYGAMLARSALLVGLRGDIDSARQKLDEAAAIHGGVSETRAFHTERDIRAEIETVAGNLELAEAALRDIRQALEGEGDRYYGSTSVAALADVVAQQGRADEALALAFEAERLASRDDWWVACIGAIARTYAAITQGRTADAVELSGAAMTIADGHDVRRYRGEARLARAAAVGAAGDAVGARHALEEARELADAHGALLEVRRVERAMRTLEGS